MNEQVRDNGLLSAPAILTAQGDILYGTAANTPGRLPKDANATRYLSNTGTNNNPAWAQVDVSNGLTGTMTVANGGTGASTLTDGGVLLGSGTGAVTAMAVLADGAMIVGDGTTDPVAESGATLRSSIGVGTNDNVEFSNLTLTGGTVTMTGAATDVDLADNNAAALSFDSAGKAGIIVLVTTDGSEGVTMSGALTITGDLTVNGTTTTVNSTTTLVADPLIVQSYGTTGTPTYDSGFIVERGSATNSGWIWDESADEFAAISTDETGSTAGDVTIAAYHDVHVLGAEVDGVLDVDGSIAFDGTTAALNGTGAITLTSTSTSAAGIYLRANGGVNETVKIHSDLGTGTDSIDILSDVGGIKITPGAGKAVLLGGATVFNEEDTVTYNATDTVVDCTLGNKFLLTFGAGNITDLYLHPPAGPANIMLRIKQDASAGNRTVTNWYKNGGTVGSPSGTDKIHFAGGTKPTLSTATNAVDVFAFYYDGTDFHATSSMDSKAYS